MTQRTLDLRCDIRACPLNSAEYWHVKSESPGLYRSWWWGAGCEFSRRYLLRWCNRSRGHSLRTLNLPVSLACMIIDRKKESRGQVRMIPARLPGSKWSNSSERAPMWEVDLWSATTTRMIIHDQNCPKRFGILMANFGSVRTKWMLSNKIRFNLFFSE